MLEGQILDKYQVISKLSAGDMAVVYLSDDTVLRCQVAGNATDPRGVTALVHSDTALESHLLPVKYRI